MMAGEHRRCSEFGDEYVLYTDSQNIEAILEDCPGYAEWVDDPGSLFRWIIDGELEEVWASSYSVPWVWVEYIRLV